MDEHELRAQEPMTDPQQELIERLMNILSVLAKRAGGAIHIPVAELREAPSRLRVIYDDADDSVKVEVSDMGLPTLTPRAPNTRLN